MSWDTPCYQCALDTSENTYIDLIRLAISIKTFVLTGRIWKVSVRCSNLDFQFMAECENTRIMSPSWNFDQRMELWPMHVDYVCCEAVHRFMRNMRLFDLPIVTLESIGIIDV